AENGYKSVDLFQKLGNAYYFNSELDKANKWYTELFALNQPVAAEYYYRYAQSLKAIGDYNKANAMLDEFAKQSGKDSRAQLYNQQKDYLEIIKQNSGRYDVENAGINSDYSDYGTSFLGNQLVFTSARDTMGFFKRKDKWTNQSFTNLYSSKVNADGSLSAPEKFSSKVASKFHESTPVFTKDGQTMYFTRNNFLDGKKQK
ncbi:tetratricopeptide repeat protein, partial [Flavobacterium sp. '19STA2R22 D10 B1']|uniref:tetratricopeptide repeat protein n=1 Tax=Flavobacterium aerium TaxID=3037261 RepID=UPI003556E72C